MSNSVLITQVLLPNLVSTLIMVMVSSLIATIVGFALAVVLVITNKKGLSPNLKVYRLLDFVVNIIRSFPFIILMVALMPFTRSLVGTRLEHQHAIVPFQPFA